MLVICSDLHLTDGTLNRSLSPDAFSILVERLQDMAAAASWRADGSYHPIEQLDVVLLGDVFDVRLPEEREARPAPAERAEGLSVGELRDGGGVGENGPELVICERGTRSAEAVRLLRAAGRNARYLGGGLMWRSASGTEKT